MSDQTVSQFISAHFNDEEMETDEFFWEMLSKVSDFGDRGTLQSMYFGDSDMEEIIALARTMS